MIKKKIELPLGSKLKEVKDDILVFEFEGSKTTPKFKVGDFVRCAKEEFETQLTKENLTTEPLKYIPQVGDCFKFYYEDLGWYYGICKCINNDLVKCYVALTFSNLVLDGSYSIIRNFIKITQEEIQIEIAKYDKKWNFETNTLEPLQKYPKGTWVKWTGAYPTLGRVVKLNLHDGRENYVLEHTNDPERNYNSCFVDNLEIADTTSVLRHLKFLNKMFDADGEVIELDEFAHLPQKIEDLKELAGHYINGYNIITKVSGGLKKNEDINRNAFPSKYAKAIHIQPQLLQLYEVWKDEDIDCRDDCFVIKFYKNKLAIIQACWDINELFKFKTKAKAKRFLNQFRDLLEQYKPLMGGQ